MGHTYTWACMTRLQIISVYRYIGLYALSYCMYDIVWTPSRADASPIFYHLGSTFYLVGRWGSQELGLLTIWPFAVEQL